MTLEHQDDPRVVRAIGASGLLRLLDGAVDVVWRAGAASWSGGAWHRFIERWSSLPSSARDRRAGMVLCTAAVTHVVLQLWQEQPAGWLWLMIPALAVSIGVLLSARGTAKG